MNFEPDELLEKAKSRDHGAFVEALTPFLPMLYAYALTLCADHHTAQDVVQQTALIAWRKIDLLFAEMDFGSWLKGIARREALSEKRQARRVGLAVEAVLEAAFDDPTPVAFNAERRALEECLKKLDSQAATIVHAHYFQRERLTVIAERQHLNGNTVRTVLYRARLALRNCIQASLARGES